MSKPDGGQAFPEPGVWTDPDGNVLDIVLNVGDGEGPWPNPLWVRDWVQAQQRA